MSLKTDYQDAIFSGDKKYAIVDNGDGTSTITDQTEYEQEGTRFGAKDINDTNAAVNRLGDMVKITLPTSGWAGSAAPYEQVVEVEGITEDDKPMPGVIYPESCTRAQQKVINKAVGYIYDIETGDGTVTFRCTALPTTEFTIGLKGVS